MKIHTNDFKEEIKKFGRQIDSIITYELEGETIELGAEQLNSITPHYESVLLKSVMKQLDIESSVDIPLNTIINYQFGLKVGNNYEYVNFGNYVVYSSEKQEDTNSYKIVCYDKMLYSMIPYESMEITYPITIRDYIIAICDRLGLEFKNEEDEFANYDKEIQNELYLDNEGNSLDYTFRDVLDELSQVTASTICINEDDDKLEIRYINDTQDSIDEEYLKDINVNFGEKFGPINSVVLTRSANSDSIYLRDEESVLENGLCEIRISDNQIMNFNDRNQYLEDLLEVLDGIEYYINDFSSTGITYYNLGDMYNVSIDNNDYKCIMFNDEVNVTQGLEEKIYTDMPEETNTDYEKSNKTDRKINQAWLIVNKQESTIEGLVSKTSILDDGVYTKEQVDNLLINTETGLTNIFSEAGGNNIFRNTGLWFSATTNEAMLYPNTDVYPSDELFMGNQVAYEFWSGKVEKVKNDKAVNMTSMLLMNDILSQEQLVPNGKYTIAFKYKKVNILSNISVKINDVLYPLTSNNEESFVQTIDVNSQYISLQFISDRDESCEIYDLMVNVGETSLAYSQNQNETTTDSVNISKGITITSSDLDVTFKANADGIRTLDKSGNELTKFTDTGMTTKKATIESKSQIVGLLYQEVGSQTWITKL